MVTDCSYPRIGVQDKLYIAYTHNIPIIGGSNDNMANMKLFGLLAIMLVAMAGAAFALPLTIDEVKVDGTSLDEDQNNRLSIDRDESFKVKVTLTATADRDNIVGQVFITGYEHEADEPIWDMVGPFDIEADTVYTKTFTLSLPEDVDEDSYKLRVMLSDRNSDEVFQNYNLKIDEQRHSLKITDVILYPENSITAGSALLTTVRVENFGQRDEDDVRVEVSIPALGKTVTDYIDEVESNEQEETEELYIRIPRETEAGDYEMIVTVDYNDLRDTVEKSVVVHVDSDETYVATQQPVTTITVGSELENVNQGESVIFPVTITNSGNTDTAYTVAVAGASDWATVKISPTSTQIVKAGESNSFYLSIGVNKDASEGTHVFTATVSTADGEVEQIALTANVIKSGSILGTIGKVFGIALIAVLIVLIIVGLVAGYNRMRGDETDESQTYY